MCITGYSGSLTFCTISIKSRRFRTEKSLKNSALKDKCTNIKLFKKQEKVYTKQQKVQTVTQPYAVI